MLWLVRLVLGSCPVYLTPLLPCFPPSSLLAGFIAWIASPIVEASCFEFSRTLGEVIYVGAGAMVVWATPLVEFYGPRVSRVPEFFVMVSGGRQDGREGSEETTRTNRKGGI